MSAAAPRRLPLASSASELLCRTCGFCCDGLLFRFVTVERADCEALGAASVRVARRDDGTLRLDQPCAAHVGDACTVYELRPQRCRSYRCLLLARLERGEMDLAAARVTVDRVKGVRRELGTLCGLPDGYGIDELEHWLDARRAELGEARFRREHARLLLEGGKLLLLVRRFFEPRRPDPGRPNDGR